MALHGSLKASTCLKRNGICYYLLYSLNLASDDRSVPSGSRANLYSRDLYQAPYHSQVDLEDWNDFDCEEGFDPSAKKNQTSQPADAIESTQWSMSDCHG